MTISPIKISPKTTTMTPTSSVKGMSEPSASEPSEPLMPLMQVYMRRKFFEPKLMSTPPPIAEQFLYDLRKMISVARERIRNRRHVPRLPPVAESDDETTISATTANGNCIISGSPQTKSEQIKNGTEENKKEEKIAPNICCLNKENSKEKEKEEFIRNSGNLQQKMDYCLVEKKGEEGKGGEEEGEGDIPKEIINEKEVEITEEGKEEMKEEGDNKAFFEGIICSETKIDLLGSLYTADLFNETLELTEIMENELEKEELEKEEEKIGENCGNIEEMKEKDKKVELNDNEFLEKDEGKIDKFEKEIDLEREESEEELKKNEEIIMPIEDCFVQKSAETTEEKKTTKSEQVETTKEIKQSIPLIPQTLPEHQLNNAYIPPPSRIPSAIPSTINGKSPKIPLKFSSSNRKTSSNNNCVKPPPLPPRPPPQINGQSNGTTPVMKESFLTVMAAKRKAASGIARRQKQNGREEEDKSLSIDNNNSSPTKEENSSPAPRNGRRLFYATCLQPPSYYMGDGDSTTMKKSLPRRKKVAAVNNTNQTSTPTGIPTPTTTTLVK
uniref:Uncharacterized protein n=1 Tax=Meloidogyne incognita TaxID=6306 RepID=A0A914MGQ0_MELIC